MASGREQPLGKRVLHRRDGGVCNRHRDAAADGGRRVGHCAYHARARRQLRLETGDAPSGGNGQIERVGPSDAGDLRQHGFHYLRLYGEEDDCRRHRQFVD